ncbi:MAG: hypothetical protein ACREBM_01645 [Sphingomicrobium sp.]
MRGVSLLLLGATLASCSAVPPAPTRDASQQQTFMRLTGDKVAGPPISCLPQWNTNDMSIIDGRTVGFRVGTGTVNIVTLTDGCSMLGVGTYAMKTRSFGGQGLCTGDIVQVIDTLNQMVAGSCTVGSIIPYTRPGR